MRKEIPWTKAVLDTFLEESGINYRIELGDEKAIILEGLLKTRLAGWTISKQAIKYNISVDTVNKYIREMIETDEVKERKNMGCSVLLIVGILAPIIGLLIMTGSNDYGTQLY